MKLFVSWSGKRSEALAKALYDWLPLVLHFVEPWLSKSDIQAGERWSVEVAKELEQSNFGILCVTRDNLTSPWILFEAGALAKSMQDGRVMPLLLDLDFKEISGPLAQFQAKKAERDGFWELVLGLNKASTTPIADAQLEKLFAALWGDLQKQIGEIPTSEDAAKKARPQGEILEELVASVRNVEIRVRDVIEDEPFYRPRRRGRKQIVTVELMEQYRPGDPVRLLVVASLLRDDAPWVYELARETYVALTTGDARAVEKVGRRLLEAMELFARGPYIDDSVTDRAVHYLMAEASSAVDAARVQMVRRRSGDEAKAVGSGGGVVIRRPTTEKLATGIIDRKAQDQD